VGSAATISVKTGGTGGIGQLRWRGQDFEADRYYSDGPGSILTAELIFQYSNHLQI
jgi:hypothetical protein